jgi:hypothetical protein
MRRVLTAIVALAASACSSTSGGASADAGDDYGQPICILQDGGTSYNCDGQMVAACAQSGQPVGAPCTSLMAQCTGCMGQTPPNGVGAGFYCTCQDAGDGGLQWSCVGTEHLCK